VQRAHLASLLLSAAKSPISSRMAQPPVLGVRDAHLTFGGRPTFSGVTLSLGRGERACLVGRNGSGKSTLLKALAGHVELDRGEIFRQPGARIGYLPQDLVFDPQSTAADYVAAGLPQDPAADRRHLVAAALAEIELDPARGLAELSGGEGRRLALARALIGEPDALLLDEPTNHLDIAAIEWLEARLGESRAALLLVSHDRAFLTRLSQRSFWLDRGTVRALDQGYAAFDEWSETVLAAEAAESVREAKRIASETQWLREGISARRRRNQGRVRRLAELRAARAQRVTSRDAKLGAQSAEAGGRLVIEAERIAKSFRAADGGEIVIARDLSIRLLKGDRVGIIGKNGAGKSTLLGLLLGEIAPDRGTVRHGTGLRPAIFDQRRAALDPASTPWAFLAGEGDTVAVQGRPRHVASYLKDFLFEERQFQAKIAALSGGERNRLLLAKVLASPANLLVLDEPTNDLDLETLDLLEEVLGDWDGTLLLVSHDRDFLDRLVTSVIAVEGGGVVHEYVGGYTDYLRQRPAPRAPAPATRKPPPRAPPPRQAERPRTDRLSFQEKRDLDALPERIAALEAEKAQLEATLADPQAYASDRAAFEATTRRQVTLEAELAVAEERWLALAARAEAIAAGER
jgi:ATP-binding cassette subfamily F protein uup